MAKTIPVRDAVIRLLSEERLARKKPEWRARCYAEVLALYAHRLAIAQDKNPRHRDDGGPGRSPGTAEGERMDGMSEGGADFGASLDQALAAVAEAMETEAAPLHPHLRAARPGGR